jgi:cephalosporin hydroxylase
MISNQEYLPRLSKRINLLREITGGSQSCGWMFDELAFLMYGLVKFYKPKLVIQTGHLWGKSALVILEALNDDLFVNTFLEEKEQNADPQFTKFVMTHKPLLSNSKFISIDPCPLDVPKSDKGIEQLGNWYSNFAFYKMTSDCFFRENLERLQSEFAESRVMGIVDGDHTAQGCFNDLENLFSLKAGLIVVDDTIWLPQLSLVAKNFASKREYHLLNLPFYNGIAILLGRSEFESKLEQLTVSVLGAETGGRAVALKRAPMNFCMSALKFFKNKFKQS